MEFKDKLNTLLLSKKSYFYIFLILISGILFMVLNTNENVNQSKNDSLSLSTNNSTETLIKNILSKVEGVGMVDILINNEPKQKNNNNSFLNNEINDNDSEKIYGVIVVAQGAENPRVLFEIKKNVSIFLDVPLHRIIVNKMS